MTVSKRMKLQENEPDQIGVNKANYLSTVDRWKWRSYHFILEKKFHF